MSTDDIQPYWKQQAHNLVTTGRCDLPLTVDDVARRVARSEQFPTAMQHACGGDTRLIQMLRLTAAAELCKEFDDEH